MITVVHRLEMPDRSEVAFARAWRQAMAAIQRQAPGLRGAHLLRNERDPRQLVIVTRWESEAAWRAYWEQGPPDPQGDPDRNEIFYELERLKDDPSPERGQP